VYLISDEGLHEAYKSNIAMLLFDNINITPHTANILAVAILNLTFDLEKNR